MLFKISAFFILLSFMYTSHGCRPEVCRKRREVSESEVVLQLQGCSGQTKPWVRQMSFCLDKSTAEVALVMKDWYARTYESCTEDCDFVRAGTDRREDIDLCVNCFKARVVDADFVREDNSSLPEIFRCLNEYIYASLSNELPVFEAETRSRGRVTVPRTRPANDWWSLTVRLPCKPPVFQFFNAYCINAFSDDVRARDFVLSQNKLIKSRDIVFIARFNDACRFNVEDVEIIWSESVPAFATPQLSSFPSQFPPRREEFGNIFFDSEAYARLMETDDGDAPEELPGRPRRRRSARKMSQQKLGISMPCAVRKFTVEDRNGFPINVKTNKNRHLIDPPLFYKYGDLTIRRPDTDTFNFTLDYGYRNTGCIFGASEPKITVNPPAGWLEASDPVICYTCNGASSEADCKRQGSMVTCRSGELCQSEVRQITRNQISITKTCKQARACENNWINNNRYQCRPGKVSSVCRCCCGDDQCNGDSYHCT